MYSMSNGGSLRISSASSVSSPPFHGIADLEPALGVVAHREACAVAERRAVANLEILLAEVDDVPAAALRRQQHRERRVLLRLDRLDRVHDDAQQPPGFAHSVFLAFCVQVRSFAKVRNATITRFCAFRRLERARTRLADLAKFACGSRWKASRRYVKRRVESEGPRRGRRRERLSSLREEPMCRQQCSEPEERPAGSQDSRHRR